MDELSYPESYDDEFIQFMGLAKSLISKLPRREDREIATKWITKLCSMKSPSVVVKKNRNRFFKYMLTVMHLGTQTIPDHYGFPQYSNKRGLVGNQEAGKDYVSRWSADNRTYVAIKALPGRGALVYMAVSTLPELGWDLHR